MTITTAWAGEDIPLTIAYDDGGTAVDPDDQDADGDPDAFITIIDNGSDTEVVSSVEMTNTATGEFEFVWDSDVDGNGAGVYWVEISAEFSAETKIEKDSIALE